MGVRQETPKAVKSSIRASARTPSRLADELIGTALRAPLPGMASRFLETIQPGPRARQNHLRHYQGKVALVGTLPERSSEARKAANRVAKILCSNEIVVQGGMTGLRPMVPATLEWLEGIDEPEWLSDSAHMLKKAIAKESDIVACENFSPMRVPPGVTLHHPEAAYDTLSTGLHELEVQAKQASPAYAYANPSLVVLADANYAAGIFPWINEGRLADGGVIGLVRVGRRAEHNLWIPLEAREDIEQRALAKLQSNLGV